MIERSREVVFLASFEAVNWIREFQKDFFLIDICGLHGLLNPDPCISQVGDVGGICGIEVFKMPNQLSTKKARISYAEDRETLASLREICKRKNQTLTEVLKEAVSEYLADHQVEGGRDKKDKKT